MDHDIVVLDNKEYQAVVGDATCNGCSFFRKTVHECFSVDCYPCERDDKINVIYKPHFKQVNGKWTQESTSD